MIHKDYIKLLGTGEMAEQSRALAPAAESLSLVPGTHVRQLSTAYAPNSRQTKILFWHPRASKLMCTYSQTYTPIHVIKKYSKYLN